MRSRALLTPLLCLPVLTGCYVMQAASGQWEVVRRSQPIDEVVADPGTSEQVRARLGVVTEAREFAERELDLPANRSYRKYADLGRPYAVWNVVATPEFSVEPRRWCFPIAGCVSYRGYFDEQRARDYALKLSTRGDDVSVGGVATYSTLGHLPDPVFSPMLAWRDTRLVGTLFHELAHQRCYVAGDSEFNEAFASVVEEEGVRRWLEARGETATLAAYRRANERQAQFAALLREARTRLAELYASPVTAETMRIEKQREFGLLKFQYERLRHDWGNDAAYDAWFARSLNNAHLAAVATYEDCVPGLRRELEAAGSMPEFYRRAEKLGELSLGERRKALCAGATAEASAATTRPGATTGERMPGS